MMTTDNHEGPLRPGEPAVLLFRGRGFISRAIRWQTRSRYSHAAARMPDGRIIEAWQGAGVRVKRLSDWSDIDAFRVRGMTGAQWETAICLMRAQLGKAYDYRGVLRFLSRRGPKEDDRWFCSELVFHALHHAGVDLLARVGAGAVSPAMLSWSPLLEPAPRA